MGYLFILHGYLSSSLFLSFFLFCLFFRTRSLNFQKSDILFSEHLCVGVGHDSAGLLPRFDWISDQYSVPRQPASSGQTDCL